MRIDLTGKRFGRLLVIQEADSRYRKRHWLCRCDCGGANTVSTGGLHSGQTKSCGCLYLDSRHTIRKTHGQSRTPEYRVWKGMISRCENSGRDFYPRYGGRGIKVCARWRHSFPAFLTDMGLRPDDRHTLERKDNDGNYSPRNCTWATKEAQGQNTSRTKRIPFKGETMSITAWARRLKRTRPTIRKRIAEGRPLDA